MKVDFPELNSPYEIIKVTKCVIRISVVTNSKNKGNTRKINNSSKFTRPFCLLKRNMSLKISEI